MIVSIPVPHMTMCVLSLDNPGKQTIWGSINLRGSWGVPVWGKDSPSGEEEVAGGGRRKEGRREGGIGRGDWCGTVCPVRR